jgi:hypothetical protein
MMRDLLRRVSALERQQVRLRIGEVTDLAPLDVALGGSDVPYENVNAVGPVTDGETVAALMAGGNLLVLGRLLAGAGFRFGLATVTWPGGSPNATTTTVTHELGRAPQAAFLTGVDTTNMVLSQPTRNATDFTVNATTRDGTSPAAATVRNFYWLAL